ncbi:ABC transporter permease subunit [Hymenobacter sp. DH14]|uniref:ABC transporter permease subunit n=1 Tax=Hymenobacter cyanobacteriorum TaxID=2926463 RepID=A0A9X1VPZ1_9BACT|nr:ABC transporter permease subunit [Hymenobacter cyanobacteriorum]MCI1189941.1 ABC transporter permease subunit [Hymenobacter cyanobacteriorum]
MASLSAAGLRLGPGQWLALAWLVGLLALATLAPALPLPYPPGTPDLAHMAEGPSSATHHWLGTDALGRDVLSGLVFGARTALFLTLPAALLAALLGGIAGGAAGFWGNRLRLGIGGWVLAVSILAGVLGFSRTMVAVGAGLAAALWASGRLFRRAIALSVPLDSLVLGTATALDTVPRLILVLALVARGGVSALGLGLVLGLTSWASPARQVRARMLAVRALPFIDAARASGLSPVRVWWLHALPHALRPLQTALPLSIAGLLALESTLSFLGVGLPPEAASWGQQLSAARQAPQAWWAFTFPALALAATIFSMHFLSRSRRLSVPSPNR